MVEGEKVTTKRPDCTIHWNEADRYKIPEFHCTSCCEMTVSCDRVTFDDAMTKRSPTVVTDPVPFQTEFLQFEVIVEVNEPEMVRRASETFM